MLVSCSPPAKLYTATYREGERGLPNVKSPPKATFVADTAMDRTVPFSPNCTPASAPDTLIAAALDRRESFTIVNSPPMYTALADLPMAKTVPFVVGFQLLSTAPLDRTYARFFRAFPPTVVNEPPMYQPPAPSETTAYTGPFTRGKVPVGSPVLVESGTPLPVLGPIRPNCPPRYSVLPLRAIVYTGPSVTH